MWMATKALEDFITSAPVAVLDEMVRLLCWAQLGITSLDKEHLAFFAEDLERFSQLERTLRLRREQLG